LNLTDDRRDVLGEAISVSLYGGDSAITHSVELGIAENNTASLGGLQRVFGALRDHLPFVLCDAAML
jgi:hypothetical protein